MNIKKIFLALLVGLGLVGFAQLTFTVWMLSGYNSRPDTLIKATKENASPDEIRKAVLPLFSKYQGKPDSSQAGVVPRNEIPEEIKSLPLFSTIPTNLNVILTVWAGTNHNALLFAAGGGFGHWGIAVCKDENDREFDNAESYTYWKKGIYFYYGP